MTRGLIYAVMFYFAALLLTAAGGYAFYGGNAGRIFEVISLVARWIGPLLVAPAGFVIGFFHDKQIQKREETKLRQQAKVVSSAAASTPAPRVGPPAPEPQPGTPMSDEVREYLKQTSAVDLKGIREFIEETRRHKLDDLPGGKKNPED